MNKTRSFLISFLELKEMLCFVVLGVLLYIILAIYLYIYTLNNIPEVNSLKMEIEDVKELDFFPVH